LFKQIWQRAVEQRGNQGNPVFLWVDEAQFFVTKNDMLFQQTARSSRVATIYLTQSIANYKAALGDNNQTSNITDSLTGNFQTIIFHANGCPVTNEYAEKFFGTEITSLVDYSPDSEIHTLNLRQSYNPVLQANNFTRLRKGSKVNNGIVTGYIFQAGREWECNEYKNWTECEFDQNTEKHHDFK
jgi:hypothetical protein